MASMAQTIFSHELRREDAIIQQASQMQTAFSFVTAALFMVLPVVVENRGCLSYGFIIGAFASITFIMTLSLVFASIAQRRKKIKDYPNISSLHEYIIKNYVFFKTEAQRQKYIVDSLSVIQESYRKRTEERGLFISLSFLCFYFALLACLIWFVIALIILF